MTRLSFVDRLYWLASFPLGGFAAWIFDRYTVPFPHVLLGLVMGRAPTRSTAK